MVVKEALQRWITRLLQPWIHQEPLHIQLKVGFSGCQVDLCNLNLDVSALNSLLVKSSKLVIHSATIGALTLNFRACRNPALELQVHDLKIVVRPRSLNDELWESSNKQWTTEQKRKNALLCSDPQGVALHAISEKITGIQSSSNWFTTLWTNMTLQCLKVELHNTLIEVQIPEKPLPEILAESATGNIFYSCCLRAKYFKVEEGFLGHNKSPGGLLIAAILSFFYFYRGAEDCKKCSIENLCLELKTVDPLHVRSDEIDSQYVILLKELMLSIKLKHLQVTDLEFDVPDIRFALYPRNIDKLMKILEKINNCGEKYATSAKQRRLAEKIEHGMSGRNLWQSALKDILSLSPRYRFQRLVETIILRLRYANAYESWLLEVGCGLKQGCVRSVFSNSKRKQIASCIDGLWKEVCEKEIKLPVEAVVQVRRLVRLKVWPQFIEDNMEVLDTDLRGKKNSLCLSLVIALFSSLLRGLSKIMWCLYAAILYSCRALLNLVYIFCSFLSKDSFSQPVAESHAAVEQTFIIYDRKISAYFIEVSKLRYTVKICKVFIDAACNEFYDMHVQTDNRVSASSISGTSISFVIENLCLVHSSDANVMEFSIICGDLSAQIFSAACLERELNLESSAWSRQRVGLSTDDNVVKIFLRSSQVPQVHDFEKSRNVGGRMSVSSMPHAILENHQGHTWSNWENMIWKSNLPSGVASSTLTEKPFLLCQFESFVIDPSLRNPNSGLLRCDIALGELFFDLDNLSLTYIIVLLLQLLDASQWTSFYVSNKSSHFSNRSASYSVDRDRGWEELYDLYTGKMKQAMMSIIQEKNIHLNAAIDGPKIQLSPFPEEYLKFEKHTGLAENHTSFIIDLGNLETAIWPALLEVQETDSGNNINIMWLKKLPVLDHFRDMRSDFQVGHEQIGSNIYLKVEHAVLICENKSGNKQFPLLRPLTITIESSICRNQINSLLTMERALLVNLGCESSALDLVCSVDELLFVIQIFEGCTKGMLDTIHEFAGRDASPSLEQCRDFDNHQSNYQYLQNSSMRLPSQKFDTAISPIFTSCAVILTFDLEKINILFESSRRKLTGYRLKELESGFGHGRQYKIRKENFKPDDSWRSDLPDMDIKVSFQNFNMVFSWGDTKEVQLSLRLSGIEAQVRHNIVETHTTSENHTQELKIKPVKEVARAHTNVLAELIFQRCTINLYVGPHVYETIQGENTRKRSSAQENATNCTGKSFKMQQDELALGSSQGRNISEFYAMDILSSVPSCWLLVDVDLSECFLTDCSLEILISQATQKLSGSKRMHAVFAVEKGFRTVSVNVEGGCLGLQVAPLAIFIQSYWAYGFFLEDIFSLVMSSIEKLKVRASEVSGMEAATKDGASRTSLQQVKRSLSFSRISSQESTSHAPQHLQRSLSLPIISSGESSQIMLGVGGVNTNAPVMRMLSLRVQQFSFIFADVDVSGGAQGVLLETDIKTTTEIGYNKDKISFSLSRLMMLGLHSNKTVTMIKEKDDHVPHFGSISLASFSGEAQNEPNFQFPFPVSSLSGRNTSKTLKDQVVQNRLSESGPSSSNSNFAGGDCCILECMTASFNIEGVSARAEHFNRKHRDAWNGQCSISGVDLAFTTSEILMLLSWTSSLCELSTRNAVTAQTMFNCKYEQMEAAELEAKIPNGAIVAVKDVQEHLYLAVEKIQNKYRLIGVPHYTLVGDKALFKVKYENPGFWGKSQSWFSLLSIHAKNDDGDPYRIHYLPGSNLVNVSSTKDNSWELWCTVPFKYNKEDGDENVGFHGHLYKKMLHLINRKSRKGLAFVNGLPMLDKQPGHPLKLKIFSYDALLKSIPIAIPTLPSNAFDRDGSSNMQTLYEKSAVMETVLPQVIVTIDKLAITILYEASGTVHFLPLLRLCVDDAQFVLQVSSSKIRIISTSKLMLESFESQRSMWKEILRPVEICVIYRAVNTENRQGFGEKMPICFNTMLKRVDLSVSEPSLDICLFLTGELNLAGPYTIKHSPVSANCCKIENCTGLDLLCCFEDKADIKIGSRQTQSFLIRNMVSRRGLHPDSTKDMTLQLLYSSTVSSTPVHISLEAPGVTTLRTKIVSNESQGRPSGSLVVIDVSKQNQDGFTIVVSPVVRIHNATGLSLELCCRRPQQREENGAVVLLKDGDIVDDSMAAFDALKYSGEMRKALISLSLGNYLLCVRPATSEKFIVESERPHFFEWSEDLKGVKAVRLSSLFEKLSYRIKKKFSGLLSESSFSTIHCGSKTAHTKFKDLYFLVRTTRRKLPITRSHISDHREKESSIVACHEQQDILILPTIQVSNLLELDIAVTSETSALEISEDSSNHILVQGGCKEYMYADLCKLFLTVTLCKFNEKSRPINAGDWEKVSHNSKGDLHGLAVELDFRDGKKLVMMRLSRGDRGLLEVVIYSPYTLQNDTHIPFICFASKQKTFLWRGRGKNNLESTPTGHGIHLDPGSKISWIQRSDKLLIRRTEQNAVVSLLDLEFFSGFTEISLELPEAGLKDVVKLGVCSRVSSSNVLEPTQTIYLVPRHIVVNHSNEDIFVCQNGLQETEDAKKSLGPGQRAVLNLKILPGEDKPVRSAGNILKMHGNSSPDYSLLVQFSLKEDGWTWSGSICAASLGRFFLKFRNGSSILRNSSPIGNTLREKQITRFAVVDVREERSSLIMYFSMISPESLPYQINNSLHKASILFHQKGLTEVDVLKPGATIGYVWDDLTAPHELVVNVAGTQLWREIALDKLCPWKSLGKSKHIRGFTLPLPSDNTSDIPDELDLSKVGYEVYADGPIRILCLCEDIDRRKRREQRAQNEFLHAKIDCKVSYMGITLLEEGTQDHEDSNQNNWYIPIISARTGSLMLEFTIASKHTLCQFKLETFEVDAKWQGAPFVAMLRVHEQDTFERDETVLHIFAIVSNHASNPNQVKYSSILLKPINLNIDEDTLMKLVPFYRTSLAQSTSSSREIYFESFEIHPIKIIANFLPGNPQANYTSAQETLRALLHSVIKVPTIKGATVELNGILLSHALVTFRKLAIKCAQHYSWYMMRALYVAKGSHILPPAFASLFDDSAFSSLHVFFDPAKGFINLQGLTLGMFDMLRNGVKIKGYFGTRRYIVDLERTMKTAGSNILFAVITEASDSILKGAETNGFDGMVNGFHRGILKLAMEPSTLSTAFVKGSSTRRIKLDYSAGMNETYVEGYLQGMLDALYRQVYLKVKVVDDQVILKNLPPNSTLIDEIIRCTKNFLTGEGLLASESSTVGYSLRRLQGDSDWKVGPQLKALCEQIFIIFAIRTLRRETQKILGMRDSSTKTTTAKDSPKDQKGGLLSVSDSYHMKENRKQDKQSPRSVLTRFLISSAVAYIDGRLCRHIPNAIARRIVSGFLLSFVE